MKNQEQIDEITAGLLSCLTQIDGLELIGLYLCGSAVSSGLQPDSDLDYLLVTQRSLNQDQRRQMVSYLLGVSGWTGHSSAFPDAALRRPIEITSLCLDTVENATAAPVRDFQYGEWLRAEYLDGLLPQPTEDPDLPVLIATAHSANLRVYGPELRELIAPTSANDLQQAILRSSKIVAGEIVGDERNVLLTLARMIVTLQNGKIVSKDDAAGLVLDQFPKHHALLELARAGYRGERVDQWAQHRDETSELVAMMLSLIKRSGPK